MKTPRKISAPRMPKKNTVLQQRRNSEIAEHQHENEHVVERKRPLDDISGEKLYPICCPAELPDCYLYRQNNKANVAQTAVHADASRNPITCDLR